LIDYPNLTGPLGCIVSSQLATLRELDEFYSLEDAYLFLDVIKVDAHNRRVLQAAAAKETN